ncbi:hypothetical protein TWF718_008007 [Orbilia javanica]|uniref:Uncharacterized protein n=1 Tax=Orbilia javanica TaxID=47235 RepID=A0AAN8RGY3_9PEZI
MDPTPGRSIDLPQRFELPAANGPHSLSMQLNNRLVQWMCLRIYGIETSRRIPVILKFCLASLRRIQSACIAHLTALLITRTS